MVKLSARDAKRFLRNPDPDCGAVLIYGPETMRIADYAKRTIDAVVGKDGRKEMRVDRVDAETAVSDAGFLSNLLKSAGFFSGKRAVQLDGASDAATNAVSYALGQRGEGDAFLVVTAGSLRPASSLRKCFETHKHAMCAPVYADAATPMEIRELTERAGIRDVSSSASTDLSALAQAISPLELGQVMEKLALLKGRDGQAITPEDVQACAPATSEVQIDQLVELVASRDADRVGPAFSQVVGRGNSPVSICIAATRFFRRIHQVACDPAGPEAGVTRLRPPVLGPRRDRMLAHANRWGTRGAEAAIRELIMTDRLLRSGRKYPAKEFVEHALIRVAMMRSRR